MIMKVKGEQAVRVCSPFCLLVKGVNDCLYVIYASINPSIQFIQPLIVE